MIDNLGIDPPPRPAPPRKMKVDWEHVSPRPVVPSEGSIETICRTWVKANLKGALATRELESKYIKDLVGLFIEEDCAFVDGYDLGKELDDECGWEMTMELCIDLEELIAVIDQATVKAEYAWVKANNIRPSFDKGDRVLTFKGWGKVVHAVYELGPAKYIVQLEDDPGDSTIVVPYEELEPIQP